jgi:hypothetical protein
MPSREVPHKFLVAFSYAGEQQTLVQSIAEAVEEHLGSGSVFLAEWFEHYIAGADSDLRLQEIYSDKSELVVVCLSGDYGQKPWPLAEYEAIRARRLKLRTSDDEKDSFRILPLRVADGEVKGTPFNTIYLDARTKSAAQTAELIVNRLRLIRPDAGRNRGGAPRFVYLAECTPDLEDPAKPINRERMKTFLENLGWVVLPNTEYPAEEYRSLVEQDLKQCMAFIQLLGPYPWKRGGFDHIQNEIAATLGIQRFRYRSSEIDLTKVEPPHRQFLEGSDIISAGFDDFLVHLEKELTALGHLRVGKEQNADKPPLVRVIIRSSNPDVLWERVFQWIYVQEKILSDQLGPGESFEAKHRGEPCHGFLVVCDAAAQEDGPLSPRDDLQQCRLIQFREKDAARRPPVALVYWPPPPPSWAKLLRSTPLKLYYVSAETCASADTPGELDKFFAEVRRVAG